MKLLNFFRPTEIFETFSDLVKDVSNYVYYRKQISNMAKKGIFARNKMRTDVLKRVYYVVNLEPETLMSIDYADLERSRIFESVYTLQNDLMNYNLTEIIEIKSERIKDSEYYAYLVWIKYKRTTTYKEILSVIAYGAVAFYLVKFGIFAFHNQESILQMIKSYILSK